MSRLIEWIQTKLPAIPSVPGAAMRYIVWYALFLVICAGLDVLMILADWWGSGKPNLAEMRQFLSTMLSGAAVAAVGFVCRWLVDSNGDGVPDEAERDDRPYPPYPTNSGKGDKK